MSKKYRPYRPKHYCTCPGIPQLGFICGRIRRNDGSKLCDRCEYVKDMRIPKLKATTITTHVFTPDGDIVSTKQTIYDPIPEKDFSDYED